MRSGASIVEVVVAFAVLGACLPAIFSASGIAATMAGRAAMLEGAVIVAEAAADSVLSLDAVESGEWTEGPYDVSIAVAQDGGVSRVTIPVTHFEGRTERELRLDIVHAAPPPRIDAF